MSDYFRHAAMALNNANDTLRGEIKALKGEIEAKCTEIQAKQCQIDSLMLEYCPFEMTDEQVEAWAKHQRKSLFSDEKIKAAIVAPDPEITLHVEFPFMTESIVVPTTFVFNRLSNQWAPKGQ